MIVLHYILNIQSLKYYFIICKCLSTHDDARNSVVHLVVERKKRDGKIRGVHSRKNLANHL